MPLADLDLPTWRETGVLVQQDFLSAAALDEVRSWVDVLERAAGAVDGILQYDEVAAGGADIRCRTENFVPFHAGMRKLLTTGRLIDVASELLGEQALLYKEKINYKNAGGAGFAAHQDAPAYPFVKATITCMVAVDDSTIDNGCLEVVEGRHHELITPDDSGCIPADIAVGLPWKAVPVPAGSLLWFNWFVPHRSAQNNSANRRRAIYLTYNGVSDGDHRSTYYQAKREQLAGQPDRISLISHFAGTSHVAQGARR